MRVIGVAVDQRVINVENAVLNTQWNIFHHPLKRLSHSRNVEGREVSVAGVDRQLPEPGGQIQRGEKCR